MLDEKNIKERSKVILSTYQKFNWIFTIHTLYLLLFFIVPAILIICGSFFLFKEIHVEKNLFLICYIFLLLILIGFILILRFFLILRSDFYLLLSVDEYYKINLLTNLSFQSKQKLLNNLIKGQAPGPRKRLGKRKEKLLKYYKHNTEKLLNL